MASSSEQPRNPWPLRIFLSAVVAVALGFAGAAGADVWEAFKSIVW